MARVVVSSTGPPSNSISLLITPSELASSAGVWSNLSSRASELSGAPVSQAQMPFTVIRSWLSDGMSYALKPDATEIVPPDLGPLIQIPYDPRVGDWLV
jgi:hypothetical protein